MNVTEWKPSEGCSACKQAEKIMGKMTRISVQWHGLAKNKIVELEQQKAELLEALELLEAVDFGANGSVERGARLARIAIAKAKEE
jgi:hypothetical protein